MATIPENNAAQGANAPEVNVDSGRAALSRRQLLKGVATGSVALASIRPIETLAQAGPVIVKPNGQICSISGMQSTGASVKPGTVVCGGYSPGYYQTASRWRLFDSISGVNQYYVLVGGVKYYADKFGSTPTLAVSLFSSPTGSTTRSLLASWGLRDILGSGPGPNNVDEAHWLTALLNAQNSSTLNLNYPYTTAQIIALYHSTGATYTNALAFFKTMENL